MTTQRVAISRRDFLIGTAAAGAGLSLGLYLPFGPRTASAAAGTPEVNAWVVIKPDDTVVIRIARSEMGQGTLTGLAQLVAEELECDWSRVRTEYPTPGQSLARNRVWGSFATGGSQGIRGSHLYVRKGGAVAREMLIEAAAEGNDTLLDKFLESGTLDVDDWVRRTTGAAFDDGGALAASGKVDEAVLAALHEERGLRDFKAFYFHNCVYERVFETGRLLRSESIRDACGHCLLLPRH